MITLFLIVPFLACLPGFYGNHCKETCDCCIKLKGKMGISVEYGPNEAEFKLNIYSMIAHVYIKTTGHFKLKLSSGNLPVFYIRRHRRRRQRDTIIRPQKFYTNLFFVFVRNEMTVNVNLINQKKDVKE